MNAAELITSFFVLLNTTLLFGLLSWVIKKKLYPMIVSYYHEEQTTQHAASEALTILHIDCDKQCHTLQQETAKVDHLQKSLHAWKEACANQQKQQEIAWLAHTQQVQEKVNARIAYINQMRLYKKILQQAYDEAYQELNVLYSTSKTAQEYQDKLVAHLNTKERDGYS